jgi:hypothetical protein
MIVACFIIALSSFLCGWSLLRSISWWVHWLFSLFSLLWTWSLFIWSWFKREKEVLCRCFGCDPCLLHHGARFLCRHDLYLDGLYPCFEMSFFILHTFPIVEHVQWAFLVCGRHAICACNHWWLFSPLWLLWLGHMCFDLLYCLSGLCLSWGLSNLIW